MIVNSLRNSNLRPACAQDGFTLIEVMVALVVVAMALPALVMLVLAQIDGAAHVRDKTYAMWIAENQLTRLNLLNNKELFPTYKIAEKDSGSVDMMGLQWKWEYTTRKAEELPVQGVLELEIGVAMLGVAESGGFKGVKDMDKADPVARLVGYLGE